MCSLPKTVRMLYTNLQWMYKYFVIKYIFWYLAWSSCFHIRFIVSFCFFRVSVLGKHNYSAADFMRQDVFNSIRTYLASGQSALLVNFQTHFLKNIKTVCIFSLLVTEALLLLVWLFYYYLKINCGYNYTKLVQLDYSFDKYHHKHSNYYAF